MKDTELKLISELMKNSRKSDRELAKVIGVSQPTVTRARARLEKEGYIQEYTAIPDFRRLGYEIMAFIFVKIKEGLGAEELQKARMITQEDLSKKAPTEIILFERGLGLGYTGVIISFHKNYSEYTRFIQTFREASTTEAYVHENVESFLIDLKDKVRYRPLTLSVLADDVLKMEEEKE